MPILSLEVIRESYLLKDYSPLNPYFFPTGNKLVRPGKFINEILGWFSNKERTHKQQNLGVISLNT